MQIQKQRRRKRKFGDAAAVAVHLVQIPLSWWIASWKRRQIKGAQNLPLQKVKRVSLKKILANQKNQKLPKEVTPAHLHHFQAQKRTNPGNPQVSKSPRVWTQKWRKGFLNSKQRRPWWWRSSTRRRIDSTRIPALIRAIRSKWISAIKRKIKNWFVLTAFLGLFQWIPSLTLFNRRNGIVFGKVSVTACLVSQWLGEQRWTKSLRWVEKLFCPILEIRDTTGGPTIVLFVLADLAPDTRAGSTAAGQLLLVLPGTEISEIF